jgi:endonuclease/exonuclease/phosphatase family metal-dependent hydrolase
VKRLRIVTWNVGRLYTKNGNNRLDDEDIPSVAKTLHDLDGDIVLLQELVDVLQLRALMVRTGAEYLGQIAEQCEYDRKCAVLVRKRFSPEFEQHRLEPTGRGLVLAHFVAGAKRIAAASVHFDVFNRPRRRSQAEALLQITDGREEDVVLAAGDFNFDPEWAAGTQDVVDRGSWELLTSRLADTGFGMGPTLMNMWRVDHVLVRGGRGRSLVIRNRRLPLGDHDAVVCDLTVG